MVSKHFFHSPAPTTKAPCLRRFVPGTAPLFLIPRYVEFFKFPAILPAAMTNLSMYTFLHYFCNTYRIIKGTAYLIIIETAYLFFPGHLGIFFLYFNLCFSHVTCADSSSTHLRINTLQFDSMLFLQEVNRSQNTDSSFTWRRHINKRKK